MWIMLRRIRDGGRFIVRSLAAMEGLLKRVISRLILLIVLIQQDSMAYKQVLGYLYPQAQKKTWESSRTYRSLKSMLRSFGKKKSRAWNFFVSKRCYKLNMPVLMLKFWLMLPPLQKHCLVRKNENLKKIHFYQEIWKKNSQVTRYQWVISIYAIKFGIFW